MRFLVFQHAAVEHPGVLRDFLRADCIPWDAIELDQGAAIGILGSLSKKSPFGSG